MRKALAQHMERMYRHCTSVSRSIGHPCVPQLPQVSFLAPSTMHMPLYTPQQRALIMCALPILQPICINHNSAILPAICSNATPHGRALIPPHDHPRAVSTHRVAATPANSAPPAAELQPSDIQVILDVSIEGKQHTISRCVCVCEGVFIAVGVVYRVYTPSHTHTHPNTHPHTLTLTLTPSHTPSHTQQGA